MTVTRFLAKRSAAAVLATALTLLGPAVASAHPRFERSEPAAGAHLDRVPTELRLVFSAAIERAFTRLQLLGSDSTEVPLGEIRLDSARVVTAAIRGALSAGTYTVVWRVAGADGHPIRGRYSFTIAPGAAGVADVPTTEPPRGEPAGAITAPARTPAPGAHHPPTTFPRVRDSTPSRRSTSPSGGSASRRCSSSSAPSPSSPLSSSFSPAAMSTEAADCSSSV